MFFLLVFPSSTNTNIQGAAEPIKRVESCQKSFQSYFCQTRFCTEETTRWRRSMIPCELRLRSWVRRTETKRTRLKKHQKAVFIGKNQNSALSEHTQLRGVIRELCHHQPVACEAGARRGDWAKPSTLAHELPPTLLWTVMKRAFFQTPICTLFKDMLELAANSSSLASTNWGT